MDKTESTVRVMLTAIETPLYDVGVLSERGMLPGLDGIVMPRLRKLADCPEATGATGKLHLVVQGSLTIQSQGGDLSFKAQGSSLKLTSVGHAGLKSAGPAKYQTGIQKVRAGAVMVIEMVVESGLAMKEN